MNRKAHSLRGRSRWCHAHAVRVCLLKVELPQPTRSPCAAAPNALAHGSAAARSCPGLRCGSHVRAWEGGKMAAHGNRSAGSASRHSKKAWDATARLGALVVAVALTCGVGKADDQYPSRPVRIVVSFSAGGPTDTVARIIGAKMGDLLSQQFFIENKVGAGGNIGADMVAKSAPDGYTLLMATVSTHAINPGLYSKMPYDPVRDFAPVAQLGVTPTM